MVPVLALHKRSAIAIRETLYNPQSCVSKASAKSLNIESMKQSSLDLNPSNKKTRKREFLFKMNCVVPWAALADLIAPYYPEGINGRPPFPLEAMLRVHFMQQWFALSDAAMEEAFFDIPSYRKRK